MSYCIQIHRSHLRRRRWNHYLFSLLIVQSYVPASKQQLVTNDKNVFSSLAIATLSPVQVHIFYLRLFLHSPSLFPPYIILLCCHFQILNKIARPQRSLMIVFISPVIVLFTFHPSNKTIIHGFMGRRGGSLWKHFEDPLPRSWDPENFCLLMS